MVFRVLCLTLLGLLLSSPARASSILTNGSFEQGESGWTFQRNLGGGWGTVGVSANPSFGMHPSDGVRWVIFNYGDVGHPTRIYQDIATVAGRTYALSFDYAVNGQAQSLKASALDGAAVLAARTVQAHAPFSYQRFTLEFKATSTTTRIQFDDAPGYTTVWSDGCIDRVEVTAVNEPPSVTCGLASGSLWPVDHALRNVGLTIDASDDSGSFELTVEVYSDEPDHADEPGAASPDAKGAISDPALGLRLRAERAARGDGRVYLVVVTAKDAEGLKAVDFCAAVVPHDQSAKSRAAANAQAAAALEFCLENGIVPPDFVRVGDGPELGPKQ